MSVVSLEEPVPTDEQKTEKIRKESAMICGRYYLGLDHMDEIAPIRREVFGAEQGWSDDILFDETDETAIQAVVYKDMNRTIPVGVGRLHILESTGDFKIGRIAVKMDERGQGYKSEAKRS